LQPPEDDPVPSWIRSGLLAIVTAALVMACGQPGQERVLPQTDEPPNKAELARLRGELVADGSSTVYPITQAAAEEFLRYARGVRVSVGVAGTGGGFKRFCSGDTDINDASRPILREEIEACVAAGVEFIELPVAYDGLAVVVHPSNTWATCLTRDELRRVWQPEAQRKLTTWRQIRASFPDKPLKLFGPATDSGTFDYFTRAIVGTEKASRGDYQASEDDNILVTGVAGEEGALGYFGYAYVVENPDKVKVVGVDDAGDGRCVAPSVETIKDGSYQPLSRTLFLYVRKSSAERPEVRAFVEFYLSRNFTPLIQTAEVGSIALPDAVYDAIATRFRAGTTGTLFPNGAEAGATLDRYFR
jgi:phosphate transport system substrate-binding protein